MLLEEYAEAINIKLDWTYQHHRISNKRKYTVRLHDSCLVINGLQTYLYGEGFSPEVAKDNYVDKIKGRSILIGDRKIMVPHNLEG